MLDFLQLFKNYSNEQLFEIILNSKKYQPEAKNAAVDILVQRGISESEIEAQFKKESLEISKDSILDDIMPMKISRFQQNTIVLICFVFSLLFIISIFYWWKFIEDLIKEVIPINVKNIFYFLRILILPFSIYYFFQKLRKGWILFTIFIISSIIELFYSSSLVLKDINQITELRQVLFFLSIYVGPILVMLIYIFTLIFMILPSTRKLYNINNETFINITIGTIFSLMILIWLFF